MWSARSLVVHLAIQMVQGHRLSLTYPYGVAVDGAGNVYVADTVNHRIRKITTSGVVSTLAGSSSGYTDGTGTSAKFSYPSGVAVDGAGNVYVADTYNHRIRKITASGVVSTLAGMVHLAIQMVQGHRLSLTILQE